MHAIVLLSITAVSGVTGTSDGTWVPTLCSGQRRKWQCITVMFTQFFGKENILGEGSSQIAEGTFLIEKSITGKSNHF